MLKGKFGMLEIHKNNFILFFKIWKAVVREEKKSTQLGAFLEAPQEALSFT